MAVQLFKNKYAMNFEEAYQRF